MRVLIVNTVCLNGGDFAILQSEIALLQRQFGESVQITACDDYAKESQSYHPNVSFIDPAVLRDAPLRFSRVLGSLAPFVNRLRLKLACTLMRRGIASGLVLFPQEQAFFSEYREADLVCGTGGTYLTENYSIEGRIFSLEIATWMGKPVVLFSQSVGKLSRSKLTERLARVITQCHVVFLRDQESRRNLAAVGCDSETITLLPDVVFALADRPRMEKALVRAQENRYDVKRVALCLRLWSHFKQVSSEEGMKNALAAFAGLTTHLVRERGVEVIFISTCQGIPEYHFEDSEAAQSVYDLLEDDVKRAVTVNKEFHNPSQLMDVLADVDVAVSVRMHLCILALCAGVPVIPVAYEPKLSELSEEIDPGQSVLDIETISPERMAEKFDQFVASIEERVTHQLSAVMRMSDEVNHGSDASLQALTKTDSAS